MVHAGSSWLLQPHTCPPQEQAPTGVPRGHRMVTSLQRPPAAVPQGWERECENQAWVSLEFIWSACTAHEGIPWVVRHGGGLAKEMAQPLCTPGTKQPRFNMSGEGQLTGTLRIEGGGLFEF